MEKADSITRNYRLEGTHFMAPMLINQSKFILFAWWEPTFGQVCTSSLDYPIIDENRVNVVTDRLRIIYCLLNKIIGVLLLNVLIRGVYRGTVFTTNELKS